MNDRQKEIIDTGKFVAIYRKEKDKWALYTFRPHCRATPKLLTKNKKYFENINNVK